MNGGEESAYRVLMGKPEGMRPLGRPMHRWEGNIRMKFKYDRMVWTGLIWLRIGINGRVL
jgi:hypothetical protein